MRAALQKSPMRLVSVDIGIPPAGAFVAAVIAAAMVWVLRLAAYAAAAATVVMSKLVVMVHGVAVARAAVATLNVTAAVFWCCSLL